MNTKLTCCQEKHFTFTTLSKSPSPVHGRKSFARCCCLFYTSPSDSCLCSLDLPNFSHAHHGEENRDSVNLGKEVPSCSSQFLGLNMCSCLWVQPNCWQRLNDSASLLQSYLDIHQESRLFYNLASQMTSMMETFSFMTTTNLLVINQDKENEKKSKQKDCVI